MTTITRPITDLGNRSPELNKGVKGGIKLDFEMLVAYTEDRFLVPLEHPEAVVFAGITQKKDYLDSTPIEQLEDNYNYFMQTFFDNSNGQDGDKQPNVFGDTFGFPVDGLTQPIEFNLQDFGQIVYASGNRTLHKTPGKGRFPIGVYKMTDVSLPYGDNQPSTRLYHWIDTSVNLPRYKA